MADTSKLADALQTLKDGLAADPKIGAIRADKLVGRGSCSRLDECWSDDEILADLEGDGITGVREAVLWAWDYELFWKEHATNYSSGEANCPLLAEYERFKAQVEASKAEL